MSLLLHGAAAWMLLRPAAEGGDMPGAAPPELQVDYVNQAAEVQGEQVTEAHAPPPAPSLPLPVPEPEGGPDPLPPPPEQPAPERPPLPEPPAPERPAPPGPLSPRLPVNLAGGDEDRAPLVVTGQNVVPPQPAASIHNRPPAYPAGAARRHVQGLVGLVIHVTEAGLPAWVEVVESSGDAELDNAARDAAALWRFQPARAGGVAVPFDFPISIRFTQGGRSGSMFDGEDRPGYDPRR